MLGFKLIIHPLVTWWLAFYVFDVEPLWATVAVVMAALPAGANCFVLASRYGVYVQRASSAILLSTVAAVVTVSLLFSLWVASS
jgi:predicted permease